jgi:hypothetical protein
MIESTQVLSLLALSLLAVFLAALQARSKAWPVRWARFKMPLLVGLTIVSLLAYYNFGHFHGATHIHHWEQFHYTLSAKYFRELRYDGLYVASVAAQEEERFLPLPALVRDLRDDRVVTVAAARSHMREVRARFSDERWSEFRADNLYFLRANNNPYMNEIRKDHGFNATPTWVAVASLLVGNTRIDNQCAGLLAWIDPALMALALLTVWGTFGLETALWCAIAFGTSYAGRYHWIGGSFLRCDWLASVMLAACCLQARRFAAAGLLLGYATMVRVFPVLFMALPLALAAWQWRGGCKPRWALSLCVGFVLALAGGCVAGSVATGGFRTWLEFLAQISLHKQTWLTNNVGLENVMYFDGATYMGRYADFRLPEPWIHWQSHMDSVRSEWQWLRLFIASLVLATAVCAIHRANVTESMLVGMALAFSFLNLTNYYWIMLCLVPLAGRPSLTMNLMLLNVLLCVNHFIRPQFEWRYGIMSWLLALLFIFWLHTLFKFKGNERARQE